MIIPGYSGEIKLEFVETTPAHLPTPTDVCCSIDAHCNGFSGQDCSVWFERGTIHQFLADLRQLEATRQGKATLTDYSFGCANSGTRLCLYAFDGSGHIAAQVEVNRMLYDGAYSGVNSVSIGMEVDAGCLAAVESDFIELLAVRAG